MKPRSHTLVRAEVAVVLVAVTVLGAAGRNAVRTSQTLHAGHTGGHDDSFTTALEVHLRLSHCIRLRWLQATGPELEKDLDDVGSPIVCLLPTLSHGVGACELVAEPRGQ